MGPGGQPSFTLMQGMGIQGPGINVQLPNPPSGSGDHTRHPTRSHSRRSGTPFEQSVRGGTPDHRGGGEGGAQDDRQFGVPHGRKRGAAEGGDNDADLGRGPGFDPAPGPKKPRRSSHAASGSRSRSTQPSSRATSRTETDQGGDENPLPPPSGVDWDRIFPLSPPFPGAGQLDAPADVRPAQEETQAAEGCPHDSTLAGSRVAGSSPTRGGSLPGHLPRHAIGGFGPSTHRNGPSGLARGGSLLTPQDGGWGGERGRSDPGRGGRSERAGSLLGPEGMRRSGSLHQGLPPVGAGQEGVTSRLARQGSNPTGANQQPFLSPFANAPLQQASSMQLPGGFPQFPGQFPGNMLGAGSPFFQGGGVMSPGTQFVPVQWPNVPSPQFVSGQMQPGGQMQFMQMGSAGGPMSGFGSAQGQGFNFMPVIPGGGPGAYNLVPQFQPVRQQKSAMGPTLQL
jgi:hypothetical protein